MKKILEIDGDGLVFRLAYFGEYDVAQACAISVDRMLTQLRADDARFYISCRINDGYRHRYLPSYKQHRKTGAPLPFAAELRAGYEALAEGHWLTPISEPGLEADDLCGIAATTPDGNEHIIVSFDKDLRSVPGKLYNPKSRAKTNTSKEEADRLFWTQVLTGDSTDGYKGIPKVGPRKAAQILDANNTALAVREAYKAAGLSREYMLSQAVCARILRCGDYDFKTKQLNFNYLYE